MQALLVANPVLTDTNSHRPGFGPSAIKVYRQDSPDQYGHSHLLTISLYLANTCLLLVSTLGTIAEKLVGAHHSLFTILDGSPTTSRSTLAKRMTPICSIPAVRQATTTRIFPCRKLGHLLPTILSTFSIWTSIVRIWHNMTGPTSLTNSTFSRCREMPHSH